MVTPSVFEVWAATATLKSRTSQTSRQRRNSETASSVTLLPTSIFSMKSLHVSLSNLRSGDNFGLFVSQSHDFLSHRNTESVQ